MRCFIVFASIFFSLSHESTACYPNTLCKKTRDTIIQLDSTVLTTEKTRNRGRTWYIKPTAKPTHTILAFRNFSSTRDVWVISFTALNRKRVQRFSGDLANFEVVIENAVGIIVFVPIRGRRTADFILNYYSGCHILKSTNDHINYHAYNAQDNENHPSCWFIKTPDRSDVKEVYFTLRNVKLNDGQRLAIWDLHSSKVITTVAYADYEVAATLTYESKSILIDLICTHEYCSREGNQCLVSYYGMTTADAACMERQRICISSTSSPNDDELCNISCAAFDRMFLEEYRYSLEAFAPQTGTGLIGMDDQQYITIDMREDQAVNSTIHPVRNINPRCNYLQPSQNCSKRFMQFCTPDLNCRCEKHPRTCFAAKIIVRTLLNKIQKASNTQIPSLH